MTALGDSAHKLMALLMVSGSALLAAAPNHSAKSKRTFEADISVRTERYPRPPYSGATYYIYEQAGQTMCTKLKVCNKYDQCSTKFSKGAYKDPADVATGTPYGTTPAAIIPRSKWRNHACLTKFSLTNSD